MMRIQFCILTCLGMSMYSKGVSSNPLPNPLPLTAKEDIVAFDLPEHYANDYGFLSESSYQTDDELIDILGAASDYGAQTTEPTVLDGNTTMRSTDIMNETATSEVHINDNDDGSETDSESSTVLQIDEFTTDFTSAGWGITTDEESTSTEEVSADVTTSEEETTENTTFSEEITDNTTGSEEEDMTTNELSSIDDMTTGEVYTTDDESFTSRTSSPATIQTKIDNLTSRIGYLENAVQHLLQELTDAKTTSSQINSTVEERLAQQSASIQQQDEGMALKIQVFEEGLTEHVNNMYSIISEQVANISMLSQQQPRDDFRLSQCSDIRSRRTSSFDTEETETDWLPSVDDLSAQFQDYVVTGMACTSSTGEDSELEFRDMPDHPGITQYRCSCSGIAEGTESHHRICTIHVWGCYAS